MFRASAGSSSSRTEGFVLPGCWSPVGSTQRPGSFCPRVRDTAATFPFAGSTSSEAENVSQRHKHGHRHTCKQRTLPWLATHTAADKALPAACNATRTHVKHSYRQRSPLLLSGWFTCEGTHNALKVHQHTHTFTDPPSTGTAPLHLTPRPYPSTPYPPHRSPAHQLVQLSDRW